jgi:pyruvate/2-oxoglutarate dehydrogenase complex dihydrolipoamide dehydrogenase (E3) component
MDFDVFIVGGGQAATPLSKALAAAGRSVAVAESKHLGGSCVNYGCTPTKAALASAKLAHQARRAAEYGLSISDLSVDFSAVLERARGFALDSRRSLDAAFSPGGNPQLLRGHARLRGREREGFRVDVEGRELLVREIVLDTGATSVMPPIDGLEKVPILQAENWLYGTELPRHIAIVGGGYIGLEMAQFYRRMGSAVSVIEAGAAVAEREDSDVSECLRGLLAREGIRFQLEAKVRKVAPAGQGLTIDVENGGVPRISASHLFVATGRRPNTDDLGLESVGVEMDDKGFVKVDERLSTTCAGIWAAGDIRGGPMFTHSAWDDNRILQSQMIGDGMRTTHRIVPYAIFVDPQLGRVGMTEREARKAGRRCRIARMEMSANGKAREIGEPDGMIKVIVDAEDETILGAAVLAAEGAELVHCYVAVMQAGATFRAIEDAIQIHPTLAEGLQTVFSHFKD